MFENRFDLVGTLKGKLASMNSIQKEFHDCISEIHSAENNFNMANDNFMETSIRRVEAAESHLRAILNEVRGEKKNRLEEAFYEGSNISKIATIGFDGHIIYK